MCRAGEGSVKNRSFFWRSIALSETGACRQKNQDALLALAMGASGLYAVADGMGGHFRGELASQAAIASLEKWWERIKGCIGYMPFLDIVSDLEIWIRKMNETIFSTYEALGQCGGTTLCLLFASGNTYAVINVGDSRLYRRQGRTLVQMTVDDVWENQPQFRKDENEKAEIERVKNASYGKLLQAVGAQQDLSLSVRTGMIDRKTCFFLCSDGIYKYAEEKWLRSQLQKVHRQDDLEKAAEKIKERVYQNGARDNLSLILILADMVKNRGISW